VLTEAVNGLDNGDEYDVRVRATNANGSGPWSAWSATVVPGSVPSSPGAPTLVPGDSDLTADWTEPADDGGAAVTSYDLQIDNITASHDWIIGAGLGLTEYVDGLENGENYRARVRAINAVGTGPWSAWSNTVVPQTTPDIPGAPLVAAVVTQVTIDWLEPFNGGASITAYELELEDEDDGSSIFVDPGLDLTENVTGLINGHSYRARIRAQNVNGWSDWSPWSDSAVPGSTPGAPGTPSLNPGAAEAVATWTAPTDDGGSAIVGYELEVENETTSTSAYVESGNVLATTVTNLVNGDTYRVRVRAMNGDGRGAWSSWSASVIPSTIPGTPDIPVVTAHDGSLTATWGAPADDGGDGITGYQLEVEDITASNGTVSNAGHALTLTVTGLINNNEHRARVRASNSNGWSPWSAWSNRVTPEGDTFTDDNGSIFEADIEWLAKSGITKGCNPPDNDQFCPDDSVTRGQMAAFLVRALGLADPGHVDFLDDDGSIFEGDIERLAAAGITRGCNPPIDDRFCPEDNVTRGQMAAFLVRALGLTDRGDVDFVDDGGSIFEGDIERLATAGITFGCNPPANDRFCPGDPVTRGQMAAFLRRALG
jgi:predicted RNA-binding protein with TRAM domain